MQTRDLQSMLQDWSVKHSGYDSHRPYIGLSGIADCERVLYFRFRKMNPASPSEQLKTRISYELESALVERIKGLGVYSPGEEISLFGGLIQGHTDGVIDGEDLLEIKTLALEEYLPKDGRASRRINWQVQAYLKYTRRRWAHVVYLARDTGAIQVIGLRYIPGIGEEIDRKLKVLVAAVREYQAPACSCGKCRA